MNQPNKASFLIISSNKDINNLMLACDVFEKGKVLGYLETITIDYKPEMQLTLQFAGELIPHLKEAAEKAGRFVSLVHLLYIEHGHIIERNPGIVKPYCDRAVRIISTGHKWYMLDDFLRKIGLSVTTNEERFIIDFG